MVFCCNSQHIFSQEDFKIKPQFLFCFGSWNTLLSQRYLRHGWLEKSLKGTGRWRITLLLTWPLIGFQWALIHSPEFDRDYTRLASLPRCSISWGSCEGEHIHGEIKERCLTLQYELHLNKFSSALDLCQVHKDPPSKRKDRQRR